ncbi:RloB family protein [Chryseobacterium aurantiacum]|uniref:RloB family protein n=1 Tax=Chryseobacterium aurantiacum TaxID=2116499 RepID=UPI000D124B39|nr:RloB family protein [Chryseobacterium aurantiacum]
MPREAIPLIRKGGFLEAEKLFVLSFEGEKTEVKYFNSFRKSEYFNDSGIIEIVPLKRAKNSGTDPLSVKKLLKNAKSEFPFRDTDEFWLIIDRDDWETIHKIDLEKLSLECKKESNFFLAMSNPCFEIWLILHFKDLKTFSDTEMEKLFKNESVTKKKNHIDIVLGGLQGIGYNKNPNPAKYLPLTEIAIERAKNIDIAGESYPKNLGTHVYKLIEKLLKK